MKFSSSVWWYLGALVLLTAAFTYWRGLSRLKFNECVPLTGGTKPVPINSKIIDQHSGPIPPVTSVPKVKSKASFDGFPERTWNIKSGTLLYLVMGEEHSPQRWLKRSHWKDISVLYTSWKVDVREKLRNITGPNLRVTYYPESTWTTGRNHQLQHAKLWEEEQKWQFETLIFFDFDVWLLQRMGDGKDTIVRLPRNMSDDAGLEVLNRNLRRDRPLQASIMIPYHFISEHAACVSRCFADHAVMAFHRTAIELTLPYIDIQDPESWWYSGAIQNYYAAAVYPTYCVEYQDIGVDMEFQVHGAYPRGDPKSAFISPLRLVAACLADADFPGFHASMATGDIIKKVIKNTGPCRMPAPANIDYYAIARKEGWLRYLHCLEWGPQRDIELTSS